MVDDIQTDMDKVTKYIDKLYYCAMFDTDDNRICIYFTTQKEALAFARKLYEEEKIIVCCHTPKRKDHFGVYNYIYSCNEGDTWDRTHTYGC